MSEEKNIIRKLTSYRLQIPDVCKDSSNVPHLCVHPLLLLPQSHFDFSLLTEGHFERHLNRMRNIYKEKHDLLIKEIKKLNSFWSLTGNLTMICAPAPWPYIEGKPLKEEYILGFTRMKKEDMIKGIEIIGEVLYSK